MATTKRAAKGGEYGANGEWYEGGNFINTVPENRKKEGSATKGKVRKVQVGPFEWAVQPAAGTEPLFVGAVGGVFADARGNRRPLSGVSDQALNYLGMTREELAARVERHANGERWV